MHAKRLTPYSHLHDRFHHIQRTTNADCRLTSIHSRIRIPIETGSHYLYNRAAVELVRNSDTADPDTAAELPTLGAKQTGRGPAAVSRILAVKQIGQELAVASRILAVAGFDLVPVAASPILEVARFEQNQYSDHQLNCELVPG